jgi:adenylyltransferase/sulfurtransferase
MSIIQDFFINRQVILPEIGDEGQEVKKSYRSCDWCWWFRLSRFTIYSSAGVGTIGIVDFDLIEIHNLHRQILYTEDQVGLPKATTAKALVEKLNPLIKVMAFEEKLIENASRIISHFDIVVDGSDNFTTRYLVNDTCVALGKTVVYGILGFEGQLAILITRAKIYVICFRNRQVLRMYLIAVLTGC